MVKQDKMISQQDKWPEKLNDNIGSITTTLFLKYGTNEASVETLTPTTHPILSKKWVTLMFLLKRPPHQGKYPLVLPCLCHLSEQPC